MNNENVKKFYELLKTDNALAGELKNAMNALVQQFADKRGLAFTTEEQAKFETAPRKLTDEELDQVNAACTVETAGGLVFAGGVLLAIIVRLAEMARENAVGTE